MICICRLPPPCRDQMPRRHQGKSDDALLSHGAAFVLDLFEHRLRRLSLTEY